MIKCLHCNRDFENKRETAKFCSTSCRVMYNRKNSNVSNKVTAKILNNQTLEIWDKMQDFFRSKMSEEFSKSVNLLEKATINQPPKSKEPSFFDPYESKKKGIVKSFEYFQKMKMECENEDDWYELRAEILESNLSEKQKQLLIN